MGRVRRRSSGVRLRCSRRKAGVCSRKSFAPCGRPASTSATFSPASLSRLTAQPPEAPEPTTITSYETLDFWSMFPLAFVARVPGCYNDGNVEDPVTKKPVVLPVVQATPEDPGRRHVLQG